MKIRKIFTDEVIALIALFLNLLGLVIEIAGAYVIIKDTIYLIDKIRRKGL